MKTASHSSKKALTFVEIIITVATIGVLASLAYVALSRLQEPAKEVKLESNVSSLNRAVAAYLSNGGNLSDATTPESVLEALKSVASNGKRVAGYCGAFVDSRLEAMPLTAEQETSSQPRVAWDVTKRQFYITNTGSNAVAGFRLNANLEGESQEVRENPMALAQTSKWVWDYADESLANQSLSEVDNTEVGEGGPVTDPNAPLALLPPAFSILGGTLPVEQFPILLELLNPNSETGGTVLFAVNGGGWQAYTGAPISVQPNDEIAAYIAPSGPGFLSSSVISQKYFSTNLAFSGNANANFVNPEGGENMVVKTDEPGLFEWGAPVTEDGFDSGSWLSFKGTSFSNVQADQMFKLGTLDYFNSTIWLSTQAWKVSMDLSLNLASPAISTTFTFDLELINTLNSLENTADQNADYVKLSNPSAEFTTKLNGQQYVLELVFGYLGDKGFATLDQFHVHEGSSATADLWGRFVLDETDEVQASQKNL